MDLKTPVQTHIKSEVLSANAVNLSFESGALAEEAFVHDVIVYFQTTDLGKTVVYYQEGEKEGAHADQVAVML